jgi:hypothetical protein
MSSRISDPGQLDAGWSEQELELLSAANEAMPKELAARLQQTFDLQLRAAENASQMSVTAPDSTRAAQLFALKLPFWGTLCVVALGAFAYWGWRGAPSPVANDRAATQLQAAASAAPPKAAADVAVAPELPTLPAAAQDQLRLEAELLENARAALGRGALAQARQLLGRYAGEFEHGVLQPESDVLGIELQVRFGQQRLAKAHAARFLAQYPNHPLAERVQKLVAAPKR